MSFGIGPGDCWLLAKGLRKVTILLRGEAVAGFDRYSNIYHQLAGLAEVLYRFVEEVRTQEDELFRTQIKNIRRLLKRFFATIQELKPHLGHRRKRGSLLNAIQKVKWPSHADKLSQLHRDLMDQVTLMTLLNQFRTGSIRPTAETRDPLSASFFYFEDARLKTHKIDFVSVSSWEELHQFLLRVFHRKDPGHDVIQHQRYLIHKPDLGVSIPSIKPFRDVVMKQERVRMSVIFDYEERYESRCPKCDTRRSAEFRGTALTCRKCDLLLHFQDSYDNEPDSLTKIVLEDMRSSGMRESLGKFTKDTSSLRGYSTKKSDGDGRRLEGWVRDRIADLGPRLTTTSKQSQIGDFKRVTLCKAGWPDLSGFRRYQQVMKDFSESMEGVKRWIHYFEKDFHFAVGFLKSILEAYNSRKPFIIWSQTTTRLLRDYIKRIDETKSQFRTSVMKARCLLWVHWEVMYIEGSILCWVLMFLKRWSLPEGVKREEKNLLIEALDTFPFMVMSTVQRLGFWLVHGVVEHVFAKEKPLYLPSAIQQLIMRPGVIALDFYLDRHLDNYFETHEILNSNVSKKLIPACQRWMEDVIKSEGKALQDDQVFRHLFDMMVRGCI